MRRILAWIFTVGARRRLAGRLLSRTRRLVSVPSVKAGALPRLPSPGHASIKESCRMQALQYSVSPEIPIQDLVRELTSVWGTPDRSQASSRKEYGLPENIYDDFAVWDHDG
jgi:hypothetical protein